MSAALRATSLSVAINRSALAPVRSTHWLESSVVTGAAAVDEEPFVDDPDPFVVLLVDEQPDSTNR